MSGTILLTGQLVLLVITAVLGYEGIIKDYRDGSGKLIKKGKLMRFIFLASISLSIAILILQSLQAIGDANTAANRLNNIASDLKQTSQGQQDTLKTTRQVGEDMRTVIDGMRQSLTEQDNLLKTSESLLTTTGSIQDKQSTALAKQKELLTQQRTTLGNLTSEGSYCYVVPVSVGENTILFRALFIGKFPLYDVSVEMTDPTAFEIGMEGLEGRELVEFDRKNRMRSYLGTLPRGRSYLDTIDVTGVNERDYNILISSRFLIFQERLFLTKVDTRWRFAFIIRNSNTGEVLGKYVERGFPAEKIAKVSF